MSRSNAASSHAAGGKDACSDEDCCGWDAGGAVLPRSAGAGGIEFERAPRLGAGTGAAKGNGNGAPSTCRHCGSPIAAGEHFCGSGCAYAYRILHERKWEKFYHMRDRVIAPVGETAFASDSFAWIAQAVANAETMAAEQNADSTAKSDNTKGRKLAAEETLPRNVAAEATPPPKLVGKAVADATGGSTGRGGAVLTLALQGASCAACVWLITKVYGEYCSSGRIDVDLHGGRVHLHWQRGALEAVAFARAMQGFGYNIGPLSAQSLEGGKQVQSRVMLRRIGLCAAFQMNVMLYTLPVYFGMDAEFTYAYLFSTMSMLFGTLSVWFGGSYFIRRAWQVIRKGGLSIDLPLSLGIIGSYAGSMVGWAMQAEQYIYFDFVSSFILLMLVGRWAKEVTLERNRKRLSGLQPVPETLQRLNAAGEPEQILREQLRAGERFIVGSAQRVPVESVLETERAEFDLAWVNGEPQPQVFYAGQTVPAGARYVGLAQVSLAAREAWAHSLMAQLLQKPREQTFRNRMIEVVVRGYLIGILAIAFLAGLYWLFAAGWWHAGAIVTAVLVVSCPCALGLAVPLADELAIVALRRAGVFVRNGDLWERLAQVRRVVFDKTGTLTLEMPRLRNPQALAELDAAALAALNALVIHNPHPVARSLHRALLVQGAPAALRGEVCEHVGCGVSIGGWSLGKEGWYPQSAAESLSGTATAQPNRVTEDDHAIADAHATAEGNTTATGNAAQTDMLPAGADGANAGATVLACNGQVVARFSFSESVRADARAEVTALGQHGYPCEILSGDAQPKVDAMTAALGLPQAAGIGGLSPQQKAEHIAQAGAAPALMVGDGANDSLAFDRALCRGTPVVYRGILERKSDFYYMGQGIAGIGALFRVNAARKRTEVALLAFMVIYNVLSVSAAVLGWINPLIAAILMPVSSLATLAIVAVGMRRVWASR